jgi:hypothetical protein
MIRFPRLTNGAAVVNQNVGKPSPSVFGEKLLKIHLNLVGIFVFREAQPHGKPFHMGIHHNPGHIKGGTQNTIGGLSPTPGSLINSFMVAGTSPPYRSTSPSQHPLMDLALFRKKPVGRISISNSLIGTAKKSWGDAYF